MNQSIVGSESYLISMGIIALNYICCCDAYVIFRPTIARTLYAISYLIFIVANPNKIRLMVERILLHKYGSTKIF